MHSIVNPKKENFLAAAGPPPPTMLARFHRWSLVSESPCPLLSADLPESESSSSPVASRPKNKEILLKVGKGHREVVSHE